MHYTKKRLYGKLNMKYVGIELYQKDEIFVKLLGWKNYWISNYSRLIIYDKETGYQLVEPSSDDNPKYSAYHYTCLKKENSLNPKANSKQYYHRLTARAFCINDYPSENRQVHHIIPFDPNKSCMENNRADNLLWVSDKYHKMIDSINYVLLNEEHELPKRYENLTAALKEINLNEDIFFRCLYSRYEPVVYNVEDRSTTYIFRIASSYKVYVMKIFTKELTGKQKNYIIGKFERYEKAEVEKYGVVRKSMS